MGVLRNAWPLHKHLKPRPENRSTDTPVAGGQAWGWGGSADDRGNEGFRSRAQSLGKTRDGPLLTSAYCACVAAECSICRRDVAFQSVASTSSQGPICRSLLAHHVAPPGTPAHRPPTQRRPFPASARQPHYRHGTRLFASAIHTCPALPPNNHPESSRSAGPLAPLSPPACTTLLPPSSPRPRDDPGFRGQSAARCLPQPP
ncbi:hypothetical protein B0J12DRAFT_655761 [Macrophomina phaseolina]|uniref:Uncharacterized protein n=1 Tax=Macrophomina phaseolina TaxID=35725 RepID=A0ABQ8GH71_9PEZI|nr:hypothetical protein B0J12DRAFT_655761 [Macrophomina phaseolina]